MLTPLRALRTASDAEPLPRVEELEALYGYGFLPRRGQMLMVAAESGSGKSAFLQWYLDKLNLRTLYCSADNDAHTTITRLCSQRSGYTVDAVSETLDRAGVEFFNDALEGSNLQFCFDSGPTLDDIADEIAAYVELWDEYPEIIAIDNLINVESESEGMFAGLNLIMKELHRMARETGAAVIVLHHTREEGKPTECPPKSAIQGKVSHYPERILTAAFDPASNEFKLSPVKNRGGRSDTTGRTIFRLSARLERASFEKWFSWNGGWGE
jgi:predicted ATP-dependent serine protease